MLCMVKEYQGHDPMARVPYMPRASLDDKDVLFLLRLLDLVQYHIWHMVTSRIHADTHDASYMGTLSTRWATTKNACQSTVLVSTLVLKDALGLVLGSSGHVSWATA